MSLHPQILSIAPSRYFRVPREETLRRAGYVVTSIANTSEALLAICGDTLAFDMMIVCDCMPADERTRLIATLKAISPHIPVLVIGKSRDPLADAVLSDVDAPQALLGTVASLLVS